MLSPLLFTTLERNDRPVTVEGFTVTTPPRASTSPLHIHNPTGQQPQLKIICIIVSSRAIAPPPLLDRVRKRLRCGRKKKKTTQLDFFAGVLARREERRVGERRSPAGAAVFFAADFGVLGEAFAGVCENGGWVFWEGRYHI